MSFSFDVLVVEKSARWRSGTRFRSEDRGQTRQQPRGQLWRLFSSTRLRGGSVWWRLSPCPVRACRCAGDVHLSGTVKTIRNLSRDRFHTWICCNLWPGGPDRLAAAGTAACRLLLLPSDCGCDPAHRFPVPCCV